MMKLEFFLDPEKIDTSFIQCAIFEVCTTFQSSVKIVATTYVYQVLVSLHTNCLVNANCGSVKKSC